MVAPPLTLANWLLAALPLLLLAALLVGLRWRGSRAGAAALGAAILIAWGRFGAGPEVLAVGLLRGALLSVHVLYIVWPALALYHVARAAGGIENIGWAVSSLTQNHILQLLILAFAFTTFLQGVAGFGVPVAVAAPLLIGIGYPAVQSVAVTLVGHAWSVSMGDMASSFQALQAVTGLPGHGLGLWVASLLAGCALLTALSVAHLHAGAGAIGRWPLPIVLVGLGVGGTQWLLALFDLWVVATFGAGMVGLALGLFLARTPRYRGPSRPPHLPPKPEGERVRPIPPPPEGERMSFHLAFSPYYILILVVGGATAIPSLHRALSSLSLAVALPATETALGWRTPAGTWTISPFGHPGALLAYTALLGYLAFRLAGRRVGRRKGILRATGREALPTTAAILALVCLATTMTSSGMILTLARGTWLVAGGSYLFLAPFVGLLGCIITGSNTNSNILFGSFQVTVAGLLGADPLVVAAAQSAGGALGSMMAPAKVMVGCATAKLGGREGEVLKRVTPYCLAQTALVGVACWLLA